MYVSLNGTLTAGRVPWPEFAQLAGKLGYRGVDVNLTRAMELGLDATRTLLADLKLTPAIAGMPVDVRRDDGTYQQGLPRLEAAAQFAAAIGCPRLGTYLMPSTDTPKAEMRAILKTRLAACAAVLARSHVQLAIEFVSPVHLRRLRPHEFIWRMDEMLEFAKECGSNAGLMLDSWHWRHAGATLADIAAARDRIIHVQVADAPDLPPEQIRDNERLMPGEGVIDFTAFFQALKKIGYNGGVSPEIFGRGLKEMDPEAGARLGLETTTAAMKKAGVL
jgi:sugar phosphate isomerase/epimerase